MSIPASRCASTWSPYSTYFDTLRTDVTGGGADDIFWLSNAYFAGYADSGRLIDIAETLGPNASAAWEPSVVNQFTRDGSLWGVPQLTDAGIARVLQRRPARRRGRRAEGLLSLRWSLGDDDTLRPLLARLTLDADGRSAATPGFDAGRIRQWGYNAANDLQGIYLNYIGSAGGVFSGGDRFAFDNPQSAEAFDYLVRLINTDHVAPPASDTNDNGDFSRNQFLQAAWRCFSPAPTTWRPSPTRRRSAGVSRCCPSARRAGSASPMALPPQVIRRASTQTPCGKCWPGWRSPRGNEYLGARGAAIPAVLAAQPVYYRYWASRGVDVSPFFKVLNGPRMPAPGGAGFAAGFDALKPYFDEMFLGRRDVSSSLTEAQAAANSAAEN